MNALELFEFEEIENVEKEERERFKIKDLDAANWAFRKLAALEKKQLEYEDLAKKEKERIELWLQGETEKTNQSKRFFESLLEEYFYENKQIDPKFKISTPYGKVSSRKQQSQWEYDNEIVISSLKNAGLDSLIRIKEEPSKSEIKKALHVANGQVVTPDGEIIEGIKVTERPDAIVIKVEV